MARTAQALEVYNAKRRFDKTPEPRGVLGKKSQNKGGIYTIQKHDATRLHYDLRLELNGVLKSWAVTKGPSLDPAQKRLAVRTEDHPINYAKFEGLIPKGHYGAGTVLLWDQGTWEPIGDAEAGLANGKLTFIIHGERLKGRWALVRMRAKKGERRENWLMIKERDQHMEHSAQEITDNCKRSVVSGRDLRQIEASSERVWGHSTTQKDKKKSSKTKHTKLPAFYTPALATLVDAAPVRGDWIYEMKLDGYRALTAASGNKVRIYTRNGLNWTNKFTSIAEAIADLDLDGALLDGEICAINEDGHTSFSLLQKTLKQGGMSLTYFVFDLLAFKSRSLKAMPIEARKEKLRILLQKTTRNGPIVFSDHVQGHSKVLLDSLCVKGFEGIIAKRAGSVYPHGRSNTWLKIKCKKAQEFVIVGWSPSSRGRAFSSLLLALNENNKLHYAGRVGSGFDESELTELAILFKKMERKTPAFIGTPSPAIARKAHWVEPRLVAQIEFAEFTHDRLIRQGRFLGLREDKKVKDVISEIPKKTEQISNGKIAGVTLSHPEKMLIPKQEVSKLDLATYLEMAAPRILPLMQNRLLSLVRCPEGLTKQCFFQRHASVGLSTDFYRLKIEEKNGGFDEYIYVKNMSGLIAAAQLSTIEFHVWGSSIKAIEKPERIVFDLDPDDAVTFSAVVRAALRVRDLLDALGLKSFPLVTGGKGIHVVAPIRPRHHWNVIKTFAAELAQRMATDAPAEFVATMSKKKRKGRIFIDHFRNERGATAIAPYSPRAREDASIAWPMSWQHLPRLKSAAVVTFENYRDWLKKPDYWKGYDHPQELKVSALKALKIDF